MSVIWQVFAVGVAILAVAIVANGLATAVGLSTWYGFLGAIRDQGLGGALREERIASLVFLFVAYPLILGATGYGVTRWLAA